MHNFFYIFKTRHVHKPNKSIWQTVEELKIVSFSYLTLKVKWAFDSSEIIHN